MDARAYQSLGSEREEAGGIAFVPSQERGHLTGRRLVVDGDLSVTLIVDGGRIVLELSGILDLSNVATLDRELMELEGQLRPYAVLVRLDGLELIDASGLSRLIAAVNRSLRCGWSFEISGASGQVATCLDRAGLSERFRSSPEESASKA